MRKETNSPGILNVKPFQVPALEEVRVAKRVVLPPESLSADTNAFYEVLNNETDFSVVLISSAYIDACLGALLERFCIQSSVTSKLLDPRSGVLGTFASRADACYVLGLVSKPLYQDLLVLAEMRNQFAHYHLSLDFERREIAENCKKLNYIETILRWDMKTDERMFKPEQIRDSRTRFVFSAVMITQRLLVDALGAARCVTKV